MDTPASFVSEHVGGTGRISRLSICGLSGVLVCISVSEQLRTRNVLQILLMHCPRVGIRANTDTGRADTKETSITNLKSERSYLDISDV